MVSNGGVKAMVLAAGVGSRLDPLTQQLSKPMVPLMNRPVMEHIINLLRKHGITDIMCNLHYLPDQVPHYFGAGSRLGVRMQYINEEELTGDAGGVRACRDFFGTSTFVVIMGDLITDLDLSYVIRQHQEKNAVATIALKKVEDVSQFGVAVMDENGFITGFQEKPDPSKAISNLASTGVYVCEPEIFDVMPAEGMCMFGRMVFPAMLQKNMPILGVETWGYWSDVGTPQQYLKTTFDALNGLIDLDVPCQQQDFGWVCGGSDLPSDLDVRGKLLVGYNTHIGEGVRIRGHVVIGDNCVIERNAEITDSIIWSNNIVRPNATIRDSIIGNGCLVERGARVRDEVTIEKQHNLSAERLQKEASQVRERAFALSGAGDEMLGMVPEMPSQRSCALRQAGS